MINPNEKEETYPLNRAEAFDQALAGSGRTRSENEPSNVETSRDSSRVREVYRPSSISKESS